LFPLHEPVTAGKALQSLEKFEAAEAWIPAFAGTAKAEVVNFFFVSVRILAQPPQRNPSSLSEAAVHPRGRAEPTPHLCLVLQRSTARSAEVSIPDSKIYENLPSLI
jgi:hypothetical protein